MIGLRQKQEVAKSLCWTFVNPTKQVLSSGALSIRRDKSLDYKDLFGHVNLLKSINVL